MYLQSKIRKSNYWRVIKWMQSALMFLRSYYFQRLHKYFRVNDLGFISPGSLAGFTPSSSFHSALNNWHLLSRSISKTLFSVTARGETVFSDRCVSDHHRSGKTEGRGEWGLATPVQRWVSFLLSTQRPQTGKGILITDCPNRCSSLFIYVNKKTQTPRAGTCITWTVLRPISIY